MARQTFKTTIPYSTRLKKLAGRILHARYEQHNMLPVISRLIGQIENTLDTIDERANMRAFRAKKAKEKERELLKQAEQERLGDTEGDGTEGPITTLPEGSDGRLPGGHGDRGVGPEGGGNVGVSVRSGFETGQNADLAAAGVSGRKDRPKK